MENAKKTLLERLAAGEHIWGSFSPSREQFETEGENLQPIGFRSSWHYVFGRQRVRRYDFWVRLPDGTLAHGTDNGGCIAKLRKTKRRYADLKIAASCGKLTLYANL